MKYIIIIICAVLVFSGCSQKNTEEEPETPEITETTAETDIIETQEEGGIMQKSAQAGVLWPAERALPIFASPEETLRIIHTNSLTPDERMSISALQGIVNKTKPRILLTEDGDVLPDTWIKTFGLQTSRMDIYAMIEFYKDEIGGIVVYNTQKSAHHRNAASTIANIHGYIPVTGGIKNALERQGVEFLNIIDITDWEETTPMAVYGRIYEEYWQHCTKRLLLSADPNHDFDHCRDIAAAAGAAVVWLDCTRPAERELYQKFMRDMADNREKNNETAIVLGWFTTERSGVTAGSEFGISTIPADLYISGSVYGGVTGNPDPEDRTINIPPVPPKKDVENKIYVAVFFTDGDNIQYMQRFMRKLWDSPEETQARGKVAANWTVAPGLVDIGPGILNYYYGKASDYECFVAGPSGMGYLMPTNTLREPGAALGAFLTERKYMDEYTALTERYMRKAGLRALTIWDDASDELRDSYERICRYIYGATVQNFGDRNVTEGVAGGRLWFARHETHYEGVYNTVLSDLTRKIRALQNNGEGPHFLSYQVKTWEFHTPQLVRLNDDIKARFEETAEIEFVRADHFFALYNEANGLPFNLCMNEKTTLTTATEENGSIIFDFGDIYAVSRLAVPPAISGTELELSEDGTNWTAGMLLSGGADNAVIDVNLPQVINARYAKIITHAEDFGMFSGGIEIYGRQNAALATGG
ncbi:MAG: hypothetical protein FWH24_03770 [Oscillospiraceae bacterium]|nr:hypothetical protein [Oscillospiraceae bacterium]